MKFFALVYFIVEAGRRSEVTRGTVRLDDDLESVAVAVRGDRHDVLIVSARLALEPQLIPRAAPETGEPPLHRYP